MPLCFHRFNTRSLSGLVWFASCCVRARTDSMFSSPVSARSLGSVWYETEPVRLNTHCSTSCLPLCVRHVSTEHANVSPYSVSHHQPSFVSRAPAAPFDLYLCHLPPPPPNLPPPPLLSFRLPPQGSKVRRVSGLRRLKSEAGFSVLHALCLLSCPLSSPIVF